MQALLNIVSPFTIISAIFRALIKHHLPYSETETNGGGILHIIDQFHVSLEIGSNRI